MRGRPVSQKQPTGRANTLIEIAKSAARPGEVPVVIFGRLPGVNDWQNANRHNRYKGAALVEDAKERVMSCAIYQGIKPFRRPVKVRIQWYEPNRMRDIDNIHGGVKWILDGFRACGILEDDSQQHVTSIEHEVLLDPPDPRIVVYVSEVEEQRATNPEPVPDPEKTDAKKHVERKVSKWRKK